MLTLEGLAFLALDGLAFPLNGEEDLSDATDILSILGDAGLIEPRSGDDNPLLLTVPLGEVPGVSFTNFLGTTSFGGAGPFNEFLRTTGDPGSDTRFNRLLASGQTLAGTTIL